MTLTARDGAKRLSTPPLQGRGKGWGLTANSIAELQDHARYMRNNPTEPEKRLWRSLSNSQLGGWKFRRQQVIGSYIVDFVSPRARLIVEVDGDTHDAAADAVRDAALLKQDYQVLRVTNDDVMRNFQGVLQHILEALSSSPLPFRGGAGGGASPQAMSSAALPHPNPSPEGEGLNLGTSA